MQDSRIWDGEISSSALHGFKVWGFRLLLNLGFKV